MQNSIRNFLFLGLVVACVPQIEADQNKEKSRSKHADINYFSDTIDFKHECEKINAFLAQQINQIEQGATVDSLEHLFYQAVLAGNVQACKTLIFYGADVNETIFGNDTPLMVAASCGKVWALSFGRSCAARHMPPKINFPSDAQTIERYVAVSKLLIEAGAEINAQVKFSDWTALDIATMYEHDQICSFLIAQGAKSGKEIEYEKLRDGFRDSLYWCQSSLMNKEQYDNFIEPFLKEAESLLQMVTFFKAHPDSLWSTNYFNCLINYNIAAFSKYSEPQKVYKKKIKDASENLLWCLENIKMIWQLEDLDIQKEFKKTTRLFHKANEQYYKKLRYKFRALCFLKRRSII